MNVLTEAQRNELKTLPAWFINRLKNAILYKKEMENLILEEETRFEDFRKQVVQWRTALDDEYNQSIQKLESRLEEAEKESFQNDKPVQHDGVFEKMILQRRKALELTKEALDKTRSSFKHLEEQYQGLLRQTADKESKIESFNSNVTFTRNRNMSVFNSSSFKPAEKKSNCINVPTNPIPIGEVDIQEVPVKVLLESLLELLLDKEYRLVSALLDSLKASEQEYVAGLIVRIFDANDELIPLLQYVISQEVQKTDDIGNLFRNNSISSRMISAYGRLVGHEYLRNTLKPVIDDIIYQNIALEVDPMKLLGDKVEAQRDSIYFPSKEIDANARELIRLVSTLLHAIIKTRDAAPPEFMEICALIKEIVGAKFENWKIGVGGFLFLRLYCPVIFLPPKDFGYENDKTKPEAKRTLVLVSKILQNLANFNSNSQDMVMKPFNSFILDNIPVIENYFLSMAIKPEKSTPTKQNYQLRNLMEGVLKSIVSIESRILPYLQRYPSNLFVQQWTFSKSSKLLAVYNDIAALNTPLYDIKQPVVKDFLDAIILEPKISSALLETVISMKFMASELEEIATSFVTLFEVRNSSPTLIEQAIKFECEQESHTVYTFPTSLSGFLFYKICQYRCKIALKAAFGQKVVEMARNIDSLMKTEVLIDIGNGFLNAIIAFLKLVPVSIWKICSTIASNPNLGGKYILNLLANQLFCRALEDPETYTIPSGGGDRVVKKALFMISELLRAVFKGERDESNLLVHEFLQKGNALLVNAVEEWLKKPPTTSDTNVFLESEEIGLAIDFLKEFLANNFTKVSSSLLKNSQTDAFVCFNLTDFVTGISKTRATI